MSEKDKVAVLVSDLHLTLHQPACRSDKDWMLVQREYLDQLGNIANGRYILCAGDIFDRWNPSPELINFALRYLPNKMICVPGQHDLPNHRIEQMDRSAYGVLKEAEKIQDISSRGRNIWRLQDFTVTGFGWGEKLEPCDREEDRGELQVALIHRYCWDKGFCFPGASGDSHVKNIRKFIKGYDVAVFGDNHKGFTSVFDKTKIYNCGGFIRRKSDEIDYQPSVGVLYRDGKIERVLLDTSSDCFHTVAAKREEIPVNIKQFINQLADLGEHGLNFREAVLHHLESEEIEQATKEIILRAIDQKEKP